MGLHAASPPVGLRLPAPPLPRWMLDADAHIMPLYHGPTAAVAGPTVATILLHMLCRGRREDCRARHVGSTAAVRSPQREVRMVPLYLPDEQQALNGSAPSTVPVRQQRSGNDDQNSSGAQGKWATQSGGVQQQRVGHDRLTAKSPGAQVQQRQDGAAPGSTTLGTSSRLLSSDARMPQFSRGFSGADAQRMASAAQPQVESAANVAAEVLTQTRSGQVLVEAEVSESGVWLQRKAVSCIMPQLSRALFHVHYMLIECCQQASGSCRSAPASHGRRTATPGGSAPSASGRHSQHCARGFG
jgi:hypothetical protein